MKNDITKLMYSDNSGEAIDNYITNKMVKRDRKWFIFCLLLSCAFLMLMYSNRTTRADILREARPLLDSTKLEFQQLMNFKVDSMENDYQNNRKGRRRGK